MRIICNYFINNYLELIGITKNACHSSLKKIWNLLETKNVRKLLQIAKNFYKLYALSFSSFRKNLEPR